MKRHSKIPILPATVILLVQLTFLPCQAKDPGISVLAEHSIPLSGSASGGILTLVETRNRNTRNISIATKPGESAEAVAARLADAINSSDPFEWNVGRIAGTPYTVIANGGSLILPGHVGLYAFAGTEKGLGIPEPPRSLSCTYHAEQDQIVLKWNNPKENYDGIVVLVDGFPKGPCDQISSLTDNYVFERRGRSINNVNLIVIGYRDNVLSNAAAIHLAGNSQDELFGIPFTDGVAPNWMPWSTTEKVDEAAFEQGERYAGVRRYEPVKALLTKPYYQVIKVSPQGGEHGVYRKFLGLTPGHTYRLTACLSTLEMDSIKGDWSLSLHAAPNGPAGKDLTGQQMAGLAPLPDGRSGPQAGRIAFRGPGNTTKGAFELVLSGDKSAGDPQSSHITLPAGVDTITVWVRFRCSDPNGRVGFSGVKLEDLTAIKTPKAPEQIIQDENKQEAELQSWIERESRQKQAGEKKGK